jgi:TonB family protein
MKPTHSLMVAAVVIMALAQTARAQSPQSPQSSRPVRQPERPLPNGLEIDVRDGDRLIVEGGARVRMITRYRGFARAVYSTQQHWLILMIDSSSPDTGAPDGAPDVNFTFSGLEGNWPLGDRWEGYATIDVYTLAGPGPVRPDGVGIATPEGLVQIFPLFPTPGPSGAPTTATTVFRDASAREVLTHRGFGTGSSIYSTFDQMEQGLIASAIRNAQMQGQMQQQSAGSNMSWSAAGGQGSPAGPFKKIVDVPPAYPDAARKTRVMGVVILEITIQPDGTVSNARVLRSIPLFDAAALQAVRQWRYEPTGLPNAVTLTVPVNFAPPR